MTHQDMVCAVDRLAGSIKAVGYQMIEKKMEENTCLTIKPY